MEWVLLAMVLVFAWMMARVIVAGERKDDIDGVSVVVAGTIILFLIYSATNL